ncbi:MAG: cobalamin biosynthesis protein CbiX [Peptococcaceae bacterium]|nr:cobalamin biosynthesis protein CbiX [Peptococcaceae bacterium]
MIGVLILAHGSREKETETTLDQIMSMLEQRLQLENIEEAFLQFSAINLQQGLVKLINRGATDIKIIPYFLFEGVHIKEDIPHEIREFNKIYPDIKITLGKTLGADDRLADILADRVKELI